MPCVKNYISTEQHGIMPRRSVSTNLMCYLSSLYYNLSSGKQVDTVYTDFKAAFDSIPLSLLVVKLRKLGFGGSILCEEIVTGCASVSVIVVGIGALPPECERGL